MATIVEGLFGLTPEMYGQQQQRNALAEGITLAQLDPAARGAAMTYAGARGLGIKHGRVLNDVHCVVKMPLNVLISIILIHQQKRVS